MKKFLSVALYVLIGLPLALSSLFLVSARPSLLDRGFWEATLTDERLYTALRSPELASKADPVVELEGLRLNGPVLVGAVQGHLPEDELKALARSSVGKVFDYLEGKTPVPGELDLSPLRKAVEEEIPPVAGDYARKLPAQAGSTGAAAEPGDLTARPSGSSEASIATATERALRAGVEKGIPEKAELGAPADTGLARDLRGRHLSAAGMNQDIIGLSVVSALILAGLGALGARRTGERFKLAGTYLLIPSVATLVLGCLLGVGGGSLAAGIQPHLGNLSGIGLEALSAYLSQILGAIAKGFLISGAIGTGLGAACKALRRVIEPEELPD